MAERKTVGSAVAEPVMEKQVRRGAAWLDKTLGRSWWRKIRVSELDLGEDIYEVGECGCVLAQLDYRLGGEGDYTNFVNSHRLSGRTEELGFTTSEDYESLTEAWKRIIRERRNHDATTATESVASKKTIRRAVSRSGSRDDA